MTFTVYLCIRRSEAQAQTPALHVHDHTLIISHAERSFKDLKTYKHKNFSSRRVSMLIASPRRLYTKTPVTLEVVVVDMCG